MRQSCLLHNLLLAILFLLLGRLSLWLSIPPTNAMAVVLPVGLAFSALLLRGFGLVPGVWLGSLLFGLSLGIGQGAGLTLQDGIISALIACGVTLQAIWSIYLVRRFVGYPNPLADNRSVLWFFVLIGPAGCIWSPLIGVATLYAFGLVSQDLLLARALGWWIGDVLGAIMVTPVCLILFGEPKSVWRSRRLTVLLPLCLSYVILVLVFLQVREREQTIFRNEFRDTAQRISNALQAQLDYHIKEQKSVVGLFVANPALNAEQFSRFIGSALPSQEAGQTIEWAPRVLQADRAEFEQRMRQQVGNHFRIAERVGNGMQAAAVRDEYYPLAWLVPLKGNEAAQGFDLASHPARRQAIAVARDSGLPFASEPVNPVQKRRPRQASLLMSPVYANHLPSATVLQRRDAIIGVVVTLLYPGDALAGLLSASDRTSLHLRLQDSLVDGPGGSYFDNLPGRLGRSAPLMQDRIHFAGRQLTFVADPTDAYYQSHPVWAAWSTMVVGMLFLALTSMYLLLQSGRAFNIESLVRERTQELDANQQRLGAILDNAAEGILTFDSASQVVLDNRAACQLLGEASLKGRGFASLFRQNGQPLAMPGEAGSEHEPQVGLFQEVQGVRHDGSLIDLGLSLAHLPRDQLPMTIVILHDLTEQKRVDRLKGEFISTVSHELRTPLTSIRGALGLMAGGALGQVPEPMQKLLAVAKDNAERLSVLINDILDFERLEFGGMHFSIEPHALWPLLQAAVEGNLGYAEKFSVRLVLPAQPPADVWVRVDGTRLIQILSNLISNAIKFSHQQGQVELQLDIGPEMLRVWVIDHGIGISAAFQSRIFDKFSQADGSGQRKYAGTGLGLSIAKAMIEKMGGQIGFDSVEGQGSRFYIDLPRLS